MILQDNRSIEFPKNVLMTSMGFAMVEMQGEREFSRRDSVGFLTKEAPPIRHGEDCVAVTQIEKDGKSHSNWA